MNAPFIKTWVRREVVESTNDLAKEVALEGHQPLPLVVWAGRQTRGRGRAGHSWWSDGGSLTCSLVVDPEAERLRVEHEPRLALAAAVAVIDAIEQIHPGIAARIRWPNDIEHAGRKLGGILPERLETPRGRRLVVGIGVNVATRFDGAPADVRQLAASLADHGAEFLEQQAAGHLLEGILEQVESVLPRLADDDRGLAARWNSLDTLRGEMVRIDLGGRILAGLGQGIDAEGGLILATEAGETRVFGGQVLRD